MGVGDTELAEVAIEPRSGNCSGRPGRTSPKP